MKVTDFSKSLTDFLSSYMPNICNASSNTISSYCDTFSIFLKYCRDECGITTEKFKLSNLDSELVKGFLFWLEEKRNCGISTTNQRLAVIHSFCRFILSDCPANMLQFQKVLDIPFKRKPVPIVGHLTDSDMKLILSLPNISTKAGRRDLAVLSLLYDSGARVSEISSLRVRDIRLDHPAKVHLSGKGGKQREVPMLSNTKSLLEHYLTETNLIGKNKLDEPLFTNKQRLPIGRAGIAYILKKYATEAKKHSPTIPDTITPHILRHTKAMHLLQGGINIIYIKDFLGHADIKTTEMYARADVETKRQALEKLDDTEKKIMPPWATDITLLDWLKNYGKE
jgi:site-specific recombinase XerD